MTGSEGLAMTSVEVGGKNLRDKPLMLRGRWVGKDNKRGVRGEVKLET